MTANLKVILILALLLPVLACSSGSGNKGGDILLPQAGKVYEHISCNANTLLTYALYLPSVCSNRFDKTPGQKRFPIILAFDPSGNGGLPVKRFSSLAEKYGFILVGSNDSKNMQSPEESEAVVQAMFDEIENRLPIDTSAIYVMGFSGGSRVSTATAMYKAIVKGVIGCGAGFPSGVQPPKYTFDYFGIIGLGDFNLTEMVALDKTLARMNFRHFILEFDGIHGWPRQAEIEKAWNWLVFNSMKEGRLKKNDSLIGVFSLSMTADYDSLVKQGRLLYARQNLAYRISCLEGLSDVAPLKSRFALLEGSEEYKRAMKKFNEVLEKEQKEQKLLMEAEFSKNLKWWQTRIEKYRDNKNPKLSPEDTLMNHRLLAFLGLFCYSNANALLKQNNFEQTQLVIGIYSIVEPDNPEPWYIMAVLSGRKNDTIQTLAYLRKAFDIGFRNKARAQSQPEFEIIRANSIYFDLIKKMQ
ncbi:MAG: hypothetical protein NTY96_03435 [Bacteroidetes bacterium]|nr:hypothetical protein [Bacteroidota bacterium]